MRLSSLKLSGFKSFADSTTLQFKANRTAVVGPNGCGKSNVIDAVRWVMGESSARQLRGGSMQDVIFTGTAKRKPVGMASVELRFENTHGKLGGAYNAYSELAVRRQVNRDGKSEYFLNGTKCRRRDITDIFLGTGLGPRSYAIIEQGMINRLVDAKPEEMRVFLEEAAGISRYQARRRETLQHLEHTTQNLERLEDIALELKSQLKTLKRQSETAVQYKTLATEIRTLKVEILSFQCEKSSRLQQEYTLQMNELGEHFKLVRSDMTSLEHNLASTSELFQRLIQQSTPLQMQWQQAEKKQAELKVILQQKQTLFQQNTQQLQQLEQEKIQTQDNLQLLEIQLETVYHHLDEQGEALKSVELDTQQRHQAYSDLKSKQLQVSQQFEQLKVQVQKQQQQKAQMLAHIEQLRKNITRIEQQKQTLQSQTAQMQQQFQQDDVIQIEQDRMTIQAQIVELEKTMSHAKTQLESSSEQITQQKALMTALQADMHVLQSEQKNLEQLIAKNTFKSDVDTVQLMQILKLNAQGKVQAHLIEKLLSKWLLADCVAEHFNFQAGLARQIKSSQVTEKIQIEGLICLADWIESPQHSLWRQVAVTDTLHQALAVQSQLALGQSILSLDGYHVAQDWVVGLFFDESSQAAQGALSHRVRLEDIQTSLKVIQTQSQEAECELMGLQEQLLAQQQALNVNQDIVDAEQKKLQHLDIQLAKQQSIAQAFGMQKIQLNDQLQQLNEQLEEDAMQKDDLEIDMHALILKLEKSLPEYQLVQLQLDALNDQLDQQQQQLLQQQQELEHIRQLTVQHKQQGELLEKDVTFLKAQYQQILMQMQQIKQSRDPLQFELPNLERQYAEQSQQTEKLQKTWNDWQVELNSVQAKQQQLTEMRHLHQQNDEQLRGQLEQKRLAWQASQSDLQHYSEQLKAMNSKPQLGLGIDLLAHQAQFEKAQKQFESLGAVNLAASEEYEEVSHRFADLSHQIQDLENTVSQLKDAMKNIDQETKKLFMTTFNQVNTELQNLFPKVFNGGEASLSLEDDWQSGIKLMARPPGKRNTSLALLSGGEKALTALALVFAIFRLNPAPFCVLDEVDAPLDDANVGRFCNLVKELSEQVQFIYITHNKIAMTMATDLLGVTMPEPGTSKLVTVNLEEAREYGLTAES